MATAELINEILKAHNTYRAKHSAPNLKISDKLNKIAQEWAENLASKDKSEHRPNNAYGENIYMAGSTDPNWKLKGDAVVKLWYDEIKFYKFGEPSPSNSGQVGHFTQLVWKGTTDLGIGASKSKTGKVYVVCNYEPPGNVLREFEKNVLPPNNSSKPIDEGDEDEREKIVLTPSQEKLGIQFVQPNTKIIKSMERLYSVPSEKIRVWSVWLTKIEDTAKEWISWIRSHINLVLRMSEHLRRAERQIEEEAATPRSADGKQYSQDGEREVEKTSMAADAGHELDEPSQGTQETSNEETDDTQEETEEGTGKMPGANETVQTIEEVEVSSGTDEVKPVGATEVMAEASKERVENDSTIEANDEYTIDENEVVNENEVSVDEDKTVEGEKVESLKIDWPIGVPWEPVVLTTMGETEVAKKKDDEVKVIPIPQNEEDMQRLIKDVTEQATIYRSLYKHWLEVGDQAVKEIVNRNVMTSEQVPTVEDIPYLFYVNCEPDIEIGIEHDDEKILLPDLTREKITCNFTPLYFNLADKPGKGGKPWL